MIAATRSVARTVRVTRACGTLCLLAWMTGCSLDTSPHPDGIESDILPDSGDPSPPSGAPFDGVRPPVPESDDETGAPTDAGTVPTPPEKPATAEPPGDSKPPGAEDAGMSAPNPSQVDASDPEPGAPSDPPDGPGDASGDDTDESAWDAVSKLLAATPRGREAAALQRILAAMSGDGTPEEITDALDALEDINCFREQSPCPAVCFWARSRCSTCQTEDACLTALQQNCFLRCE